MMPDLTEKFLLDGNGEVVIDLMTEKMTWTSVGRPTVAFFAGIG
jgi:hypothetical protein